MKKTLLSMIIALTLNTAYADYDKGLAAFRNKDYATAFKEFKESADKDDIDAQYGLGVMYDHGYGVPENAQEAVKWYLLAANQGNVMAQFNLGNMYNDGIGMPKNVQEALKWFTLAANNGDPSAQLNLASMYRNGDGVSKNIQEAVKYLTLSANQGNVNAQYNLGGMYEDGEYPTKENNILAYALFELAANQDNQEAIKSLNFLKNKLSNNQIQQALEIANTWEIGTPFPTEIKEK